MRQQNVGNVLRAEYLLKRQKREINKKMLPRSCRQQRRRLTLSYTKSKQTTGKRQQEPELQGKRVRGCGRNRGADRGSQLHNSILPREVRIYCELHYYLMLASGGGTNCSSFFSNSSQNPPSCIRHCTFNSVT